MSKSEYLKLADEIAAEIADGTLRPGDRLPPQRNFAYARKIAVSTASRVYVELLRRGLVVGEVGRGTFVAGSPPPGSIRGEPRDGRIDLYYRSLRCSSCLAWATCRWSRIRKDVQVNI